jgi:hypothetical protein
MRFREGWPSLLFAVAAVFCVDSLRAQNIVQGTDFSASQEFTANPVRLTDMDVGEFLFSAPRFFTSDGSAESLRISSRLEAHVVAFLDGAPWKPFHHTLGISGHEVYFDHPDELFHSLSLALPCLSAGTAQRVREFLRAELEKHPPYAEAGYDRRSGRERESYAVPDALRVTGSGRATSAFGVYAFWEYCAYSGDLEAARVHRAAIEVRMKPLLLEPYSFDEQQRGSGNAASEKLNGDLAALLGCIRLARLNGQPLVELAAMRRFGELLERRVNLERVNAQAIEPSRSATKSLHNFRLARYGTLVPEIAEVLRLRTDGVASVRLRVLREERPGWFMAFGDRLIGGENYTSPPHMARALFTGATFIEQRPGAEIAGHLDVPWCKGDLYFIEKSVYALWAAAGRPWKPL